MSMTTLYNSKKRRRWKQTVRSRERITNKGEKVEEKLNFKKQIESDFLP